MPRLAEIFAPLIEFALELDASIAAGSCGGSALRAQQRAHALLEQARAAARAAGKSQHAVESATFALVAWLDEIAARAPAWAGQTPPLQVLLFNSNNAASEFFHHLAALLPQEAEVREVYWLALAHGFTGQYYFEHGDSGELGKLKELHGRQLPVAPLALETLARERITPQPYESPPAAGPRIPQRRERVALLVAAAFAVLLPAGWLAAAWLGPPPAASPLALRVEQRLQQFPCADLSASVDAGGTTRVTGFVSRPEDIGRVEREVRALRGVEAPSFQLALRGWPHCEVVSILKPYRMRGMETQAGLGVVAMTAREGTLREGDPVRLQVTNARQDSHLWVDYFTADGAVLHLQAGQAPARRGAGERVEFGPDAPAGWLVSPPFGQVLITVLASPQPFPETADRRPHELASDYLLRLRQMLAANRGGEGLVADYAFLQTVPR